MPETCTKDGFRIRGAEMTRLETFVDAAFALCFANVAFFWYAHYTWSRRYGLEDATSTILSLTLIFIVLVYVYPLLAIYSGAFLFLPAVTPESVFAYNTSDGFRAVLIIFGLGFGSLSSIISAAERARVASRGQDRTVADGAV